MHLFCIVNIFYEPFLRISMNFNKFNRTLFGGSQELHRDLFNLLVISGLRNGPKLTMASALDSVLSSLKIKVKARANIVEKSTTCSVQQ